MIRTASAPKWPGDGYMRAVTIQTNLRSRRARNDRQFGSRQLYCHSQSVKRQCRCDRTPGAGLRCGDANNRVNIKSTTMDRRGRDMMT